MIDKLKKFMDKSIKNTISVLLAALLMLILLLSFHPFSSDTEEPVEDWLEVRPKSKR